MGSGAVVKGSKGIKFSKERGEAADGDAVMAEQLSTGTVESELSLKNKGLCTMETSPGQFSSL